MRTKLAEKVEVLQALYRVATRHLEAASNHVLKDAQHLADFSYTNTSGRDSAEVLNVAVAFGRHGDMERLVHDVMLLDNTTREGVVEALETCSVWEIFCYQVPAQAFRVYFKHPEGPPKPIVTKPPIVPGAPIERQWNHSLEVMKDILSRPEALMRPT